MNARASSVEVVARLLYTLAWWAAAPAVAGYLVWRARRQPEYLRDWRERLGLVQADGPQALVGLRIVWIHAVSVGETRAAQPLLEAILDADPGVGILLTHMTPTGRQMGRSMFVDRFPGRVAQCYLPYDEPLSVGRFLGRWRPVCGLLVETEVWPNVCAVARREGVPLALVNARLSGRSYRRGRRLRWLMGPALRSLTCVLAQTERDAERIAALGREDVQVTGNLKFDVPVPDERLALGHRWRTALGARPVVLAASTRDGEEALILQAWAARFPGDAPALLVIVPRHPQRFDEVANLVSSLGFSLTRRRDFRGAPPLPDAADRDVLLGDSMGEMFAWYAVADVVLMGGTFVDVGGQNLIEPCAVGVPVVLGPSTYNFAEAAEQAVAAGGAHRAADVGAAVDAALRLLADDNVRTASGIRAREFANAHRGATDRTLRAVGPLLGMSLPSP